MKVIPTLTMDKNNLKIHLKYHDRRIVTGRDEIKGRSGDLFKIEGDPRIWVLIRVPHEGYTIDDYAEEFYKDEGYSSVYQGGAIQSIGALKNYLRRTYGDYDYIRIWPHEFMVINLKEEDLK